MDLQLLVVVVVAVCSQFMPTHSQSVPTTIPGQVIPGYRGECPAEELLAEARQTAKGHICSIININTEDDPARSCSAIPADCPSGYYWIIPPTGPPAVQMYCNLDVGPGAWTRVAFLNMSDPNQDCPGDWTLATGLPIRLCRPSPGVSATFSTLGYTYDRVMGRIIAYQFGRTFAWYYFPQQSIEGMYVDGVSLTHGSAGSRQHIWSFFCTHDDIVTPSPADTYRCSCNYNGNWTAISDTRFVGNDYFCDTGNHNPLVYNHGLSADDPLWDGAGCNPTSSCCEFNNPPWFTKILPQPTTDDLEVRNFDGDGYGYSPVQLIELYIQ